MELMKATMSSLELVDLINSARPPGQARLLHKNFLAKIENHPGITSAKFLAHVEIDIGNGAKRLSKCYHLPKRECELMVMSESLEVQTKVYDRMCELERQLNTPAKEVVEHDDLVQLNVTVPKSLRKAIKHTAALQDTTTTALLLQAIHSLLEPKPEPVATQGTLDGAVEREFTAAYHLAQMIGCDADTAAQRANAAVLKTTGTDVLAVLGHTKPLPVKVNASGYYNPSDLVEGVSGRDMNLALEAAGLQTNVNRRWVPIKAGLKYCQVVGGGLIDYRLRWKMEVLNLLPATSKIYQ